MTEMFPDFDGATYERDMDLERLTRQLDKVFAVMVDGRWRTLAEISRTIGAPESSVSARVRDLRKEKFGRHKINRRSRGDRVSGLFEYQLVRREPVAAEQAELV